MRDDGRGPYTYCKRGLSHCEDQTCDCVDSARYRSYYQMAREHRGLDLVALGELLPWLARWTLLGALVAFVVLLTGRGRWW